MFSSLQSNEKAKQMKNAKNATTMADARRDGIEERAFRAYFRRYGEHAPQPSAGIEVETNIKGEVFVVLKNSKGELARYRLRDGKLRFTDDVPVAGAATATPIGWPRDWPPSEGFPIANEQRTPDGKHTWAELDAVLKTDGSSLDERVGALAGQKGGR
jgi:hypothetical protein